jgi:hypothetical protein
VYTETAKKNLNTEELWNFRSHDSQIFNAGIPVIGGEGPSAQNQAGSSSKQ